MAKFDYEKKFKHTLKLSERQLEQLSALHVVSVFMDDWKLKDLPNINLEWINRMKWKDFSSFNFEELKKNGLWDTGRIKVRKGKKGYILEMRFNWRSKGIKTAQMECVRCHKLRLLNWHQFCEKCTKEVGGGKGVIRWWNKL